MITRIVGDHIATMPQDSLMNVTYEPLAPAARL